MAITDQIKILNDDHDREMLDESPNNFQGQRV